MRPILVLAALALAGCAVHAQPYPAHPPPAYGVRIPPGHLPPPGECRIWFPDRPAGQQPPPGPCGALQDRVPPGAVLVWG